MRVVVFRSVETGKEISPADRYVQRLDTRFAKRVLGNLRNEAGFCTACGPDCIGCRDAYRQHFDTRLAAVLDFPSVLPSLIENPGIHVPGHVPPHDVLLAVNIHEQVLLETVKRCGEWGTKGVLVPLEAPGWVRPAVRRTADEICEDSGIEIAFPKPFCSFRPPRGSVLAEFRERFHIGRPEVNLKIEGGRIADAEVRVSAACGATYCVARWLVGRHLDENLEIEVISKQWHAFPCTASMERDPELQGETPLHVAGQAHYALLAPYKRVAGLESEWTTSPMGTRVLKPVPPEENLAKIEEAKVLILSELAKRPRVPLKALRTLERASPAALSTAVLILKQEGKITSDGAFLSPAGAS
jgi:hypothetical protein